MCVFVFVFFFLGGGGGVVCFVSFYSYSSDLVCLGPFHLSVVIMEGKGSNSNRLNKKNFAHRAQELCESRGGRPGPNSPFGPCGRKATLNLNLSHFQQQEGKLEKA